MNTPITQTEIHQAGLSNRALHALEKHGKYRTIGQLARAKDEELLAIKSLGRKSVEVIRERIAALRLAAADEYTEPKVQNDETEAMRWAREHPLIIKAIISGEMEIRIRE